MLGEMLKNLFGASRIVIAIVVIGAVTAINYTWMWTVPRCITSGYGTASPGDKDEGAFGCWPAGVAHDRLRQQAFENWARESEVQEQYRRR
jgi:hypothetical protein